MKKRKKKFVCIMMSLVIIMTMFVPNVFAEEVEDYGLENGGYDQTQDEKVPFSQYAARFRAKGLTYENIHSLQNRGYSYEEIINMPLGRIYQIIGEPADKNQSANAHSIRRAVNGAVYVTNVHGANEYYHPATMVAGGYYSDNNGTWIDQRIDALCKSMFGTTSGVSRWYYLWGEWDSDLDFHQGVDFSSSNVTKVYSSHSGKVTSVNGRVGIYNAANDKTYFYQHLEGIAVECGQYITAGTYLGTQDKTARHVHFEVQNGETCYMSFAVESASSPMGSTKPYTYMW